MLFTGILKGINLVIVLSYLLVALWGINFWLARRSIRGLSARRLARPPVQAGEPVEWAIEIRDVGSNRGAWTLEERVRESCASWLVIRSGGVAAFRPRIRATFPRRGKFVIEPLVARSTYPFGLTGRSMQLLPANEVIVLPKPARVDVERLRGWMYRAWMGADDQRRKLRRVVERAAEVHGLRDYRPGDSPRRIHWKATARRNRLTVREYEDAAPPRLLLVVDAWLPSRPTEADRARLEATVSLAAGVCRAWRREVGARLALVLVGKMSGALDGQPGPGLTAQMLGALAVEVGGPASDIAGALGQLSRLALAAPVLVVTSRDASPLGVVVGRIVGRAVAVAHAGRPESWFQLP
jgi:uncharacterized protein (DUF58 family)